MLDLEDEPMAEEDDDELDTDPTVSQLSIGNMFVSSDNHNNKNSKF